MAVGARVHRRRASGRAGDAAGEFQAGEARRQRLRRHLREQRTRLRGQYAAFYGDPRHLLHGDDEAPDAAVPDDHVGTVAQHHAGNIQRLRGFKGENGFLGGGGQREDVRRTAQAEGGMAGHRLVYQHALRRQLFNQFFKEFQKHSPHSPLPDGIKSLPTTDAPVFQRLIYPTAPHPIL